MSEQENTASISEKPLTDLPDARQTSPSIEITTAGFAYTSLIREATIPITPLCQPSP